MLALTQIGERDERPREDHFVHLCGLPGLTTSGCSNNTEEVPNSLALPGIDLEQLAGFVDRPTTSQAMREYRDALRQASKP